MRNVSFFSHDYQTGRLFRPTYTENAYGRLCLLTKGKRRSRSGALSREMSASKKILLSGAFFPLRRLRKASKVFPARFAK